MIKLMTISFYVLMTFVPTSLNANAIEGSPGGQEIYSSIEIIDPGNMKLDGIDLSSFDFIELYQYAIVKSNILYVFGLKSTGKLELASIRLDGRKRISTIEHFPMDLTPDKSKVKFTAFFMYKTEKPSQFLAVEYTVKDKRYLEVLCSNMKKTFNSINKVEVPLNTIPFFSDANDDGYTDILLWGNMDSENPLQNEMRVMFFDNQRKMFSKLETLRFLIDIVFSLYLN